MASVSPAIPLPIAGNTTERQNQMLGELLSEAVRAAWSKAIELLDRQTAQMLLEMDGKLKAEVASRVFDVIEQCSTSDKYKDEEVRSNRVYPPTYRVRPIEAQVMELRKLFPDLGACQEKLERLPLPAGAEEWFAIPRWQAVASTYNEAVELALELLVSRRRFENRIAGRLGEAYLRQTERSKLAERILAEQQAGCDILVVAAQAGMLHRGCSARRTRVTMARNEFGLGVFAFACMLLAHPERLSNCDTLMVDCGGDEYSLHGDLVFDRVPLFDYDISGIEFSIFYDDRARNLWGTPTGFLYKLA